MKQTKTNLVRFLALLMAVAMLMGISLAVVVSPLAVLAFALVSALTLACLMSVGHSTVASFWRGNRPPGDAPMQDQYSMRTQRRLWTREYPVGFRSWPTYNTHDSPESASCTPINIGTQVNMSASPGSGQRAELLVIKSANLYAFNANDQGDQLVLNSIDRPAESSSVLNITEKAHHLITLAASRLVNDIRSMADAGCCASGIAA